MKGFQTSKTPEQGERSMKKLTTPPLQERPPVGLKHQILIGL